MIRKIALTAALAVTVGFNALTAAETTRDGQVGNEALGSVFGLYGANRTAGIPNFVTPDLALVAYALLHRQSIVTLETELVMPAFSALINGLYDSLQGSEAGPVQAANVAFVGLVRTLLTGAGDCQADCADERALVEAADEIAMSPLFGRMVDYTQFKPRGRYAGDHDSERFFRAVRYAGAAFFAVQPSGATGVDVAEAARQTEQAIALARLVDDDPRLRTLRRRLETLLAWQFGRSEDLADADLLAVAANADIPPGGRGVALLARARATGRQPTIVDAVVDITQLEPELAVADVMTGWRLLPSRHDAEAALFQELVFDETGDFEGEQDQRPFGLAIIDGRAVKGFPLADELMAALGSRVASDQLTAAGETSFAGYDEAMARGRRLLGDADGAAGLQRMILRSGLTADADDPARRLESMRAFWTWHKYLGVLYAKQSYTVVAKGLVVPEPRPGADLEPAVALYLALAQAARQRPDSDGHAWRAFAADMDRLVALSLERVQGAALTEDDEAFLNGLDRSLGRLIGDIDRPIVVDVHTEPNSAQVVQQATGWAQVVERDRARGAYLSHHEFKQPMNDRLTDAQWRARLVDGAVERGT